LHEPVKVTVFTCQQDCTGRATDGIGDKAAVEAHTCPGDPVDLWRGIQWLKSSGVSADRLVRMIIAHDEKDVWPGKGFVRILLKCKSRCPKKVEEPEENPEQMQAGIMHDRSAGSRHTLK